VAYDAGESHGPGLGRLGRTGASGWDERVVDPEQTRKHHEVLVSSIILGTVALGVVIAAFVLWLRPMLNRAKDTRERDRIAQESRERKVSQFESPSKEQSLALVRAALAVRDESDVEHLIRPGPLTARQVVDYLVDMETVDGKIEDYYWMSNVDKNGLLLEGVQVIFKNPERQRSRLAFLTPDETGRWKMDFAAFARWTAPAWDSLLKLQNGRGLIRVYVAKGGYFNGPFAEDTEWESFTLLSEDLDSNVYGYCKRGSLQQRAMEYLMAAVEEGPARATLEVRKTEGASKHQLEITRVLAEDWVLADEAFENTLK
jgi:hypothetical protein